jgi:hypothetical protein
VCDGVSEVNKAATTWVDLFFPKPSMVISISDSGEVTGKSGSVRPWSSRARLKLHCFLCKATLSVFGCIKMMCGKFWITSQEPN